jgi:hypothetical protein
MTFFESLRPTAIAEYGDRSVTLFAKPVASGSRYEGRDVSYWEHQGEALVAFGPDAREMRCRKR